MSFKATNIASFNAAQYPAEYEAECTAFDASYVATHIKAFNAAWRNAQLAAERTSHIASVDATVDTTVLFSNDTPIVTAFQSA